jgi:energy-converting hydrogenase Eha subunit E
MKASEIIERVDPLDIGVPLAGSALAYWISGIGAALVVMALFIAIYAVSEAFLMSAVERREEMEEAFENEHE